MPFTILNRPWSLQGDQEWDTPLGRLVEFDACGVHNPELCVVEEVVEEAGTGNRYIHFRIQSGAMIELPLDCAILRPRCDGVPVNALFSTLRVRFDGDKGTLHMWFNPRGK
ncbi:hypothetical protein CC1G_11966 [Coprinopsis cinerea okayama7|uniref:Uncharacterized protein n=1 Tax=Coprinopsis cinerea (strain Okayama-7 / 130 / ATCC MYA-4618 / FGSC 9003) TaxID=240176 RepID=A8PHK5_COPC7|nr:hypothetical protein CC1G_11966 [Coprinopsis cinerea okayama7\|eukprot:XP_001841423.1 hypothetical protein CC1G_11966 [Coprinopsis cinerea okayama7\